MKARISTKFKTHMYQGFSGLNSARDDIALERPDNQPLLEMDHLYCSSKGYISNEPGLSSLGDYKGNVTHIRFHNSSSNTIVFAAKESAGVSLRCHGAYATQVAVWPRNASVCSAIFNRNVILAAGQSTLKSFNGSEFTDITSASVAGARYLCQASNRLVTAGFDSNPNEVQVSRVNSEKVFDSDEPIGEPSVLKAVRFNIQNLIGNGDRIRGLASFETERLAVFTNDRVLVYVTSPDYTQWALDPSVNVRYGTISHKSIVSVGSELFFCSRAGVHSMRRSMINGTTVFATPMTEDIVELYQSLLAKVTNKDDVSAYFNADDGRLHVLFPVNDLLSYRLSAALTEPKNEQEVTKLRWSLSTYAGVTCGDTLSGTEVVGTVAGLRTVAPWYSDSVHRGAGSALFPVLWHKELFQPKRGLHMVLYAAGSGRVTIASHDETGRELAVTVFDLPADAQTDYVGVPLQRQFIRPFQHEYIGLRLRIKVESTRVVRIFAIGVNTKET